MTESGGGEGYVGTDGARLYYRHIGQGPPIIILHGGPDFDHTYLLPEMDRLADSFHLIYYDQRGRGRSLGDVRPEDIGIASEIEDIERVRRHFALESAAMLGHSWGGVLALEYAIRHPDRVSHLILMNTAPASTDHFRSLRQELLRRRSAAEVARMQAIAASADYRQGDLQAEAEFYRIHYRPALHRPQDIDRIVGRLRTHFTAETVLDARAIEHRLYQDTWFADGYDLTPQLNQLDIPTLVLHGQGDFVPVEIASDIAQAIPKARLCLLPDCGHFAYLESAAEVHDQLTMFFEDRGSSNGSKPDPCAGELA
jgi:proline iminopeptidase